MKIFQKKINFITALLVYLTVFSSIAFAKETATKAVAVIHPTKGNTVNGIVTFTSVNGEVRIVAEIDGLKPGEHGFHIHEFGDCSAANASSAGEHFNPTHKKHGCPNSPEHHVGDMGNIIADEKGHGKYDLINKDIKFEGSNSIIGRSVIVHEGQDDCTTQPTGNSGARLGCGVIGLASDEYEK